MHFPLNQTPLFSLLHIVFKDSLKISPKKKKKKSPESERTHQEVLSVNEIASC